MFIKKEIGGVRDEMMFSRCWWLNHLRAHSRALFHNSIELNSKWFYIRSQHSQTSRNTRNSVYNSHNTDQEHRNFFLDTCRSRMKRARRGRKALRCVCVCAFYVFAIIVQSFCIFGDVIYARLNSNTGTRERDRNTFIWMAKYVYYYSNCVLHRIYYINIYIMLLHVYVYQCH